MENKEWTKVVKSHTAWLDIDLKEIWRFRDLIFLFVKRDFVSTYKQTILGPLWYIIQPLVSTFIFSIIFSRVAHIPTDGIPPVLFYLAGLTTWNYFSDCLVKTSSTFIANAAMFGKVYFPRMVVPLSIVISNLIKFGIQFILLLMYMIFYFIKGDNLHPNMWVFITPLLVVLMAGLGLGLGIIISSLTTKYRDLQFFLSFGVQLLMYATPIVYPLSMLHGKLRLIALLNPMTPILETFKYAYFGAGEIDLWYLLYSFFIMTVLLFFGFMIFNKVEKIFMDTV